MIRRLLLSVALPLAVSLAASTPSLAQSPVPVPVNGGPLGGRVVIVDPGHGLHNGHYTGAHGTNGAWEDANAYDIGQRLVGLLRSQGATALLTRGRQDPGAPPVQGLIARVRFAEQHHGQVFVSLHQDDSSNPRTNGVWTYYDHPGSRLLATDIQRQLVRDTGMRNLGTPTAPFYVLRNTTMPSVLVEGGFLSNPSQARVISTPAFHQQEAVAVDQGLLAYFHGTAPGTGTTALASSRLRTRGRRTLRLNPRAPRYRSRTFGRTRRAGGRRLRGVRSRGALGTGRVRTARFAAAGTRGGARVLSMIATAYGPSLRDNYPYGAVDAYGKPLKAGDIAVDPRVIPLGSRVCVSGYHTPYLPAGGFCGVARDTGGAIKGDRIDIFINGNAAQVSSFGVQHVRVTVG